MANFTFQTGATKAKAAHIRWRPNSCAVGALPDHAYNLNYGGLDEMWLGWRPDCATEYGGCFWILLEFDLTTLMAGTETVDAATLTLARKAAIAGTNPNLLCRIGVLDHASWTEGTHDGTSGSPNGATFHTYDGTNFWGNVVNGPWGSFYQPKQVQNASLTPQEFSLNATDTEWTFDLQNEVQYALDNHSGILRLLILTSFNPVLYYSTGPSTNYPLVEFHSNEASSSSNWPKLEVSAGAFADLTVEINPQAARDAGAQFRYRQNPSGDWSDWLPAGTYEAVLEDGNSYDVEYLSIDGFETPSTDTIVDSAIEDGGEVTAIGTYIAAAGIVQVFINPQSVVSTGTPTPTWRLTGHATADDTDWQTSEAILDNIAPGNWTIEFSAVQGWVTPDDIDIVVGSNMLTLKVGRYTVGLEPGAYPMGFAAVGSITNIGVAKVYPSTLEQNDGSLLIESIMGTAHAGVPATSDPDECAVLFYDLIFWSAGALSNDGLVPADVYPVLEGGPTFGVATELGRPRFVYRVYNTAKGLIDSTSAAGEEPIDDGTPQELLAASIRLPLELGRVWLVTISVYAKKPYSDSWSGGVAPWSLSLPLGVTVDGLGTNDISNRQPIPGNNFLSRAANSWQVPPDDGVLMATDWFEGTADTSRSLPGHRRFLDNAPNESRTLHRLNPYGLSIASALASNPLNYHNVVRAKEVSGFRVNKIEFAT